MAIPPRFDCSDLVIRWKNPPQDDRRAREVAEMDFRAFAAGHRSLLTDEEMRLLKDNPGHGEIWGFDWSPLPPHREDLYAFYGDRLIGHLALHISNQHARYAVVEPMNVDPPFKGRGVGSCLWDYLVARAKSMGTRILGLQVWAMDGNQDAIAFYGSRDGITRIGSAQWWIGRGKVKKLPASGFQVDFNPHAVS